MRKLTITRRRSFVASLAKMKVYLEDRQYGDTMVSGTPCRLLGTIKNGETVTFDIPNTAGMLFVTAGKNSYCSEALPIFEGEADIFLSGQNYYDRISGNAFRFDGVKLLKECFTRKSGKLHHRGNTRLRTACGIGSTKSFVHSLLQCRKRFLLGIAADRG